MRRRRLFLSCVLLLVSCFIAGAPELIFAAPNLTANYTVAAIETSAVNDHGAGNILEIAVLEPDENNPVRVDTVMVKVGSGSSTDELTLYMKETGADTGRFTYTLYMSSRKTNKQLLNMSGQDKVNIKYVDKTVPQGGIKEIVKTVKWDYRSTVLTLDKEEYAGYNSTAEISLFNMELNTDSKKSENITVEVKTSYSKSIRLELRETKVDSGLFTGKLRFGKSTKSGERILKMSGNDSITVSYVNRKDKADVAECSAAWVPQDATLTLDRPQYSGNSAPVNITLEDWDVAEDSAKRDEVKVEVRLKGKKTGKAVRLKETKGASGIFTGTVYINEPDARKTSIALSPSDIMEVVYLDKDTSTGNETERIAGAVWTGISKPELTVDKPSYKGYNTYMTISLKDPDYNRNIAIQERLEIVVKTSGGKTSARYYLKETDVNTGVFTAQLLLSADVVNNNTVRVADNDEITVTYINKNVSVKAGFVK